MSGYDNVGSVAGQVKNPKITMPKGMIIAIIVGMFYNFLHTHSLSLSHTDRQIDRQTDTDTGTHTHTFAKS